MSNNQRACVNEIKPSKSNNQKTSNGPLGFCGCHAIFKGNFTWPGRQKIKIAGFFYIWPYLFEIPNLSDLFAAGKSPGHPTMNGEWDPRDPAEIARQKSTEKPQSNQSLCD
jgi:hypothetical protein